MVDEYTTFALSTQRCRDWGVSDWDDFRSTSSVCDANTDLDEPERDIVAIRVAARHSELLGAWLGWVVSQVTCHLNRVMDDANALNIPISALHALQDIRRGFTGSVSSMASLTESKEASEAGWENCYW
jgi:hypothetical protein